MWPEPTHGPGRSAPYRTAAECIDWSLPCNSIFERKKPLAPATMRRIARGMFKYVLGAAEPFIAPVKSWGGGGNDARSILEPLRTTTTSKRGEHALVAPTLIQTGRGERPGQAPRALDLQAPLGTVCAGGSKHAVVAAFLAKHYGGHETPGAPLPAPMSTITTQDHHHLVTAGLTPVDEGRADQVRGFLLAYYGTEQRAKVSEPLPTITTRDRFALVTVLGQEYVIADIGMRMLAPHELAAAQGFPRDYELAPVILVKKNGRKKRLTKTAQIRMIGNSVSPPAATAIIAANFAQEREQLEAA